MLVADGVRAPNANRYSWVYPKRGTFDNSWQARQAAKFFYAATNKPAPAERNEHI